jgi:hypothetical protein
MVFLDWMATLALLVSQVFLVQGEIVGRKVIGSLVHRVPKVDLEKMEWLACLDYVVRPVMRV